MKRCSAWQAALSVVCALLAADLSAQDSKPRHPDHEDIVFARRPQRDLTLDVYLPAGTTNPPLVICIHGGGWKRGNPKNVPVLHLLDEAATRDAVAADPGDINARVTRALHLLRQDKPDEAHAVFDDITIFFETLPPGQQVVIAAINQARGERELARAMAARIYTSVLNVGERGLLQGIGEEPEEKNF